MYPPRGVVVGTTQFIAPRFRNITGTNPAAGAECSDTCPIAAGGVPAKAWLLMGYHVRLVVDGTAVARLPRLTIDDGTLVYQTFNGGQTQAASLTVDWSWIAGAGTSLGGTTVANGSAVEVPVTEGLLIPPGGRIKTVTTQLQAADDYGAPQIVVWEYLARG